MIEVFILSGNDLNLGAVNDDRELQKPE